MYQHDNARPHTARIVTNHFQQNNVDVLEWPACFLDVCPIEIMWDQLGRAVCARLATNHNLGHLRQLIGVILLHPASYRGHSYPFVYSCYMLFVPIGLPVSLHIFYMSLMLLSLVTYIAICRKCTYTNWYDYVTTMHTHWCTTVTTLYMTRHLLLACTYLGTLIEKPCHNVG